MSWPTTLGSPAGQSMDSQSADVCSTRTLMRYTQRPGAAHTRSERTRLRDGFRAAVTEELSAKLLHSRRSQREDVPDQWVWSPWPSVSIEWVRGEASLMPPGLRAFPPLVAAQPPRGISTGQWPPQGLSRLPERRTSACWKEGRYKRQHTVERRNKTRNRRIHSVPDP